MNYVGLVAQRNAREAGTDTTAFLVSGSRLAALNYWYLGAILVSPATNKTEIVNRGNLLRRRTRQAVT